MRLAVVLRFWLVHPLGRLLVAGSLLLAIFACVPKGKSVPDGGFDLKVEDLGPVKAVGAACKNDGECGRDKFCWANNFFNKSDGPTIQLGYCTATCNGDSECEPNGRCVALVNTTTGASEGNFCLAACAEQTICNNTSLRCWSGLRFDTGVCYPAVPGGKTQTCVASTQNCALPGGMGLGGCVRRGYGGSLGFCEAPCVIGTGTCSPDPLTGSARHCLVTNPDYNRDGTMNPNTLDAFLGTSCVPVPNQVRHPVTQACTGEGDFSSAFFFDTCVDGAECRPEQSTVSDRVCEALCYNPALGTKPAPSMGTVAPDCTGGKTCTDVWNLFGNAEPKYQVGVCR